MASNTPVSVNNSTQIGIDVKKMARKDKESLAEFDSQVKDIRTQLNEQLRCLDYRVETQVSIVAELQDFFRKRAEVELDYSKNLDKLAKSLLIRHKEQKQKREQWHLFSSYACWQHLVGQTRRQARDHAILSEIYSTTVIQRLSQVTEEVQRIYRRCREVGYESHEELLKVLHELHAAMKTSQTYQVEYRQAETKLRYVESQRAKLESSIAREKLEKSKKFKLIEKEILKRRNKFNDAHIKALKARNEYVLCMDAANAAIHKYFIDDLSDIIDCMDIGFHNCVARALMMHVSSEENIRRSLQISVDGMNKCLSNLDSRADKQRFLEANHAAFMIPKKFDPANYQHKIDEGNHELSVASQLKEELESRHSQLHKRLTSLRTESEEVWKTLETAESTLMEMISAKDYDVTALFSAAATAAVAGDEEKNFLSGSGSGTAASSAAAAVVASNKLPEAAVLKMRADRQETEDFYLTKFREYVLGSNLMHRLQAKYELIHKSLTQDGSQLATSPKLTVTAGSSQTTANVMGHSKPRRRRIGRTPLIGQPKLFGGSLEEYLEATNEEIPLIMKSCIRVINLYGLHHQGIFRVSGSQVEINNFREAFERGEDPLADVTDASDINSVAGVFKLFLRELREPLFPIVFFDQFMEIAQLDLKEDFKVRMREVVQTLPRAVFIVMRYLFSFLNHLSEYSDENMMDPYNLAICFGPTLVPVPEDKDQVQYQNLVNELIKNIIINAEDIFPNDGGTLYERYITREPDETEVGEAPSDTMSEDVDSEVYPSEDEAETLEAVAQFDFTARSQRELSFKKGDHLTLYTQVSGDWWKGSKDGRDGLVPDKYIMLRIRDEDRERLEVAKVPSSGSTTSSGSEAECIRRRTSSSSDTSGSVGSRMTPKAVHHTHRVQGSTTSVGEPGRGEDSISSQSSPSLDKRVSRTNDLRPGVSVALVRPTTLTCPVPASLVSSNPTIHSIPIVPETEPKFPPSPSNSCSSSSSCSLGGSSTVLPSSMAHLPIADPNVTKENQQGIDPSPVLASLEGKINDILVKAMDAAAADAISGSLGSTPGSALEDDDGTASLALSDEKSLSDSFNSLDLDESQLVGATALLNDQPTAQSGSLQNLDTSAVMGGSPFQRQTWESRSLERLNQSPTATSTPAGPSVNISVGGWPDSKPTDTIGATAVSKGSFVRKRDLWEKRSSITSQSLTTRQKHTPDLVMDLPPSIPLSSSPKEDAVTPSDSEESANSGSNASSSSGSPNSESPTSPELTTAAETFAMQNQSTLKKNKPVKKEGHEAVPESSAVKMQIAAFSSPVPAPANPLVLKNPTPKLASRFPHLYGTPTPVLPNAFAAAHSSMEDEPVKVSPAVKLKPQVMKKPSLPPTVTSPESSRRATYHHADSNHF